MSTARGLVIYFLLDYQLYFHLDTGCAHFYITSLFSYDLNLQNKCFMYFFYHGACLNRYMCALFTRYENECKCVIKV